jgi:L-glutamine-phosphate cytidylyltransferase
VTAAIILAAGRGARLGRYTRELPKALLRVAGRSLLDWHLDCLAECAIEPVVVVGGYRCERLARRGVELVEAPTWNETGPLATLLAAKPRRFAEGFLVIYADCPHHVANVRAMLECRAGIAVAGDREWRHLWQARHAEPLLDAETYRAERGWLREIGARPDGLDDVEAQFAGLLLFTAAGWLQAERIVASASPTPTDMTGLLAALLRAGVAVADVPIHGRWSEIDSADDLRLCRRRLIESRSWSHDWRTSTDALPCR